jgi:putative protease
MLNINRKDIEIMAPVGSYESLHAAIQAGADSVYFGVERLNMRAHSSMNFTLDDLAKIVAICREHGLKSYLTVNTILYDEDLEAMREILQRAKQEGVTAIIASDQAAIFYARQLGIEVHISTQLNVSNIETLKFYAQFADVVVLARELKIEQTAHIAQQIEEQQIKGPKGELVKIEMFAHGALCMAVSGKCYLSLHDAWRSANRGECRQVCRRSYEVRDRETGKELLIDNQYIMSPKDLCTIDFLDKFIGAGVRVLKIEGRARGPEYVKRVIESYDQAVRAVCDGTYSTEQAVQWKEQLATVFNRGFWQGYYMGAPAGEWSSLYGSAATHRKVYVGKVTNFFQKISVVEILIEAAELSATDDMMIIGETTGVVELKGIEIRNGAGQPVEKVSQGMICSIKSPQLIRRGDKLYKMVPV